MVSREWKNGSNSSYNCTLFLHCLLTKGKHCIVMALTRTSHIPAGQSGFSGVELRECSPEKDRLETQERAEIACYYLMNSAATAKASMMLAEMSFLCAQGLCSLCGDLG